MMKKSVTANEQLMDRLAKSWSEPQAYLVSLFRATSDGQPKAKLRLGAIPFGLLLGNFRADWEEWSFGRCYRVLRGRTQSKSQTQSSGEGRNIHCLKAAAICLLWRIHARLRQLLRGLSALLLQAHALIGLCPLAGLTQLGRETENNLKSVEAIEAAAAKSLEEFYRKL